jgi:hypothetical protein
MMTCKILSPHEALAQICCGYRSGKDNFAPAVVVAQRKREMLIAAETPDGDRCIVEEIQAIAIRLQGPCKKYPKAGASFMKNAKDRYIAVVAADAKEGDVSDGGSSWSAWRHRWRRGQLAYWADEASFRRGEEPKGRIDLLNITKISCGDCSPQEAMVNHAVGDERHKLVLSFANGKKAENWRHALRRLRSLLEKAH